MHSNAVHGSVRFSLGLEVLMCPIFGKLNELLSVQLSVQTDVLVREVVRILLIFALVRFEG